MRSTNKKGVIGTEHRASIQIISEKKMKNIAIDCFTSNPSGNMCS